MGPGCEPKNAPRGNRAGGRGRFRAFRRGGQPTDCLSKLRQDRTVGKLSRMMALLVTHSNRSNETGARRRSVAILGLVVVLLGACTSQEQKAQVQALDSALLRARMATREAVDCRDRLAQAPRYRVLAQRMPLTDIGAATLPQMADPGLATREEIAALDDWTRNLNICRERLLLAIDTALPSLGPIIEAARDDDAAAFVALAHHRLTWGATVMRLMKNRTKLRAALIAQANRTVTDISRLQQQELDRRTTILSSVIRILP